MLTSLNIESYNYSELQLIIALVYETAPYKLVKNDFEQFLSQFYS